MLYAKRSLGQNYLTDLNILKKIVSLTKIYNKDILEIGPGKGALTDQILKYKPKSLILIGLPMSNTNTPSCCSIDPA